ncbi:MAG: hypothetical protein ABSF94_15745 [Steroidobacteraceae bacterium]|jgi:hypothetical protein
MSKNAASNLEPPTADHWTGGQWPSHYRENEFDRKRIERAIAARKRYRYVSPRVDLIGGGYVVRSPCCSRKIEPDGGIVDIALLIHARAPQPWRLYRKDHERRQWRLHAVYERLGDLLDQLNADPARQFWQ